MKIRIRKNTWISRDTMDVGWGNGYVHLPPNHPLHGKSYDYINELLYVHGGLTYAEAEGESWVVGFDTAHYADTLERWSKEEVILETKRLRTQLMNLWVSKN